MSYRSVVLYHQGSSTGDHYDWMIERMGDPSQHNLMTWRCHSLECISSGGGIFECQRIADHRNHYLEYEGELTDGRGSVHKVARGQVVDWIRSSDEDHLNIVIGWENQTIRYYGQCIQSDKRVWSFRSELIETKKD